MKLRKAQKEALLQWVAEGLESDEINKRAAEFKPRFKVLRSQVTYYRKSREHNLEEIKETGEASALTTGLSLREKRVEALKKLADVMLEELTREADKRLWTQNAKTVAMEQYEYEEFNRGEVEALRGVLDDIAKEVGERRPDVQVNNTYNFNMDEWKEKRKARLKEVKALEAD